MTAFLIHIPECPTAVSVAAADEVGAQDGRVPSGAAAFKNAHYQVCTHVRVLFFVVIVYFYIASVFMPHDMHCGPISRTYGHYFVHSLLVTCGVRKLCSVFWDAMNVVMVGVVCPSSLYPVL